MLEQIGDFILTFKFAKSYPAGHQFFLDTPGTSCQEEFFLALSKFTVFIEKGAVSFVFQDIVFHLLEPYWNLSVVLSASIVPRRFR